MNPVPTPKNGLVVPDAYAWPFLLLMEPSQEQWIAGLMLKAASHPILRRP